MAKEMRDVCTPRRRKDGKTYWHKIGTAFLSEEGKINIEFDSLPIGDSEGRASVSLFQKREDHAGASSPARQSPSAPTLDDDIPF